MAVLLVNICATVESAVQSAVAPRVLALIDIANEPDGDLYPVLDLVVFHVVDIHLGHLAAAVVLPLQECEGQRVVGDAVAARRVLRTKGVRDRQRVLDAAGDRHREELRVAVRVHESVENPSAGTEHNFVAHRLKGSATEAVAMRPRREVIAEVAEAVEKDE